MEQSGKTATGIEVPSSVVEGLGSGKRPSVRMTIKGHTYRSSVASMGGRFMVGVNAENREAAVVAGLDTVDVADTARVTSSSRPTSGSSRRSSDRASTRRS